MTADASDVGQKPQSGTAKALGIESFVQDLFKPSPTHPRETPSAMTAELSTAASETRVVVCPGEQNLDVEDPKIRGLKEKIIAETSKDVGTSGNFSAETQEDWRKLFDAFKQAGFSQNNIETAIKDLSDTTTDKLHEEYPDSRPGVFASDTGPNSFALGVAYEGASPKGPRPSFVMGEFTNADNAGCEQPENPILEDPQVREQINKIMDETSKDLAQSNAIMPKTEDDWRNLYKMYKEAGFSSAQIGFAWRDIESKINQQMHTDSGPYPVLHISKLPNGLLKYDIRREESPGQHAPPIRIDD
jgi:hypothetical protein